MSYSSEKVYEMMTELERCFKTLEAHRTDIIESEPKPNPTIILLLNDTIRDVLRASITLTVVLDEIDIEENNHIT